MQEIIKLAKIKHKFTTSPNTVLYTFFLVILASSLSLLIIMYLNHKTGLNETQIHNQPQYCVEYIGSRRITKVKQRWDWMVLGWETTWEHQVLLTFVKFIMKYQKLIRTVDIGKLLNKHKRKNIILYIIYVIWGVLKWHSIPNSFINERPNSPFLVCPGNPSRG